MAMFNSYVKLPEGNDLCMSTSFSFRFQAQTNSVGIPASDASCVTVAAEITQPQQVAQPDEGRPMA